MLSFACFQDQYQQKILVFELFQVIREIYELFRSITFAAVWGNVIKKRSIFTVV